MISLFTTLCKIALIILSDEEIFWDGTYGYNYYSKRCPNCGAKGKLSSYGNYSRWLTFVSNKIILAKQIQPHRFKCTSCKATHALLPDIITPNSPYSLRFKFTVLLAYYERNSTVVTICKHFGIAVSTLYEWKKLFLLHTGLLIGVHMDKKGSPLLFLRGLLDSAHLSYKLRSFFHRHKFSFMQAKSLTAPQSIPP